MANRYIRGGLMGEDGAQLFSATSVLPASLATFRKPEKVGAMLHDSMVCLLRALRVLAGGSVDDLPGRLWIALPFSVAALFTDHCAEKNMQVVNDANPDNPGAGPIIVWPGLGPIKVFLDTDQEGAAVLTTV